MCKHEPIKKIVSTHVSGARMWVRNTTSARLLHLQVNDFTIIFSSTLKPAMQVIAISLKISFVGTFFFTISLEKMASATSILNSSYSFYDNLHARFPQDIRALLDEVGSHLTWSSKISLDFPIFLYFFYTDCIVCKVMVQ